MIILEKEHPHPWAALRQVKFVSGLEHGIMHRFGLETHPVHAPQPAIRGIDARSLGPVIRRLTVHGAGDDQPMKLLERAVGFVTKPYRQPIQQFRMRGL